MYKHCTFPALLVIASLFLLPSCGDGNQDTSESSSEVSTVQTDETARVAPLAYLEDWVGKRPSEVELWTSQPLQSRLLSLLGEEDMREFNSYMQEAMPLSREGELLYSIGVVPDDAVRGIAYLLVDPAQDRIKVFGVFGDHKIEAETPGGSLPVPESVQSRVNSVLNLK